MSNNAPIERKGDVWDRLKHGNGHIKDGRSFDEKEVYKVSKGKQTQFGDVPRNL